jgi:predicted glycoside hydrolase/deacetylase ChbG (UPF0249 family)
LLQPPNPVGEPPSSGERLNPTRYLVVTADDFGIGPATSQGILDLAHSGQVKSSVLLVTSPHAADAVQAWRRAGEPFELGWHPCLTLDHPVAPPALVPSLIQPDGRFYPLGMFMRRLWLGRVHAVEIETELRAQYEHFRELVGRAPTVVNSHHHVQVFMTVGIALQAVLAEQQPLPYLRRIREPLRTLLHIPGARAKRAFLSALGRAEARGQEQLGFPGNDWLAGITDPPWVADPDFLTRWLAAMPGRVVELTCHPGHLDSSLVGRDCTADDGHLQRRVNEFALLRQPSFQEATRRAGFVLVAPSDLSRLTKRPPAFAA